ncbi:hypothetical protein HLB23_35005 [Nocardia uniformis]|uniref:Clp R domain-containing protein n=1 Tax=Nocardia uniformis TaxID=53432 RepID=A0A849C888_9NOCA|nr:hypothetical protein [Nocardia uniformis]NNH75003.1 hypothetical protein [Nocardia uniformis]
MTEAERETERAADRSGRHAWENATVAAATVECGHRLWELLHCGLEVAAAEGARRMGAEHLLLHMLRDPGAIPSRELADMGLDPRTVFARLADYAQRVADPPNSPSH